VAQLRNGGDVRLALGELGLVARVLDGVGRHGWKYYCGLALSWRGC
jgi:hypothetical protein